MKADMKDDSRAQNRHHAERVKAKRSKYRNAETDGNKDVAVGIVACTPAMCSCFGCGNPRKFFSELTQQEKKFADKTKEGISSIGEKQVHNSIFTEPHEWPEAENEIKV